MDTIFAFLKENASSITTTIAILSFIWGIVQYLKAQRWKSAEFSLQKLNAFNEAPNTKLVQQMLDYNTCKITIETREGEKEILFNDERLMWMMRPHGVNGRLSQADMAVRGAFDKFFLDMEEINYLVRIGMLDKKAIQPYLGYWIEILGKKKGGRKPTDTIQALHNYIHYYKMPGVVSLLIRFGYFTGYDKSLVYTPFPEEE